MRRWLSPHRLTLAPDPHPWDRCVLAVEQLETRENPAPLIFPPSFDPDPFPETREDTARSFAGNTSFSVTNSDSFTFFNVHRATLTVANGTITVGTQDGVTVSGNGTSSVVLTGLIGDISSLIATGFTYTPAGFYSGNETVRLTVTDLGGDGGGEGSPTPPTGTATESFNLRVRPVVSPAVLTVAVTDEMRALSGSFALSPGLFTVAAWSDVDGSETATVTLALDAANPGGFQLFADTTEIPTAGQAGRWQVTATSPAQLQSLLDSLVLVPPSGFTGRATLTAVGTLVDSGAGLTDSRSMGGGSIGLRFFLGGSVLLPTPTVPEGTVADLGGGVFVATDPDRLSGDTNVFTITAPFGLLTFRDSALVSGMSAERVVNADDSTTITLTGDLPAINAFLATAGGLMYSAPDTDFSGLVPLAITLANLPGTPPPLPPPVPPTEVPTESPPNETPPSETPPNQPPSLEAPSLEVQPVLTPAPTTPVPTTVQTTTVQTTLVPPTVAPVGVRSAGLFAPLLVEPQAGEAPGRFTGTAGVRITPKADDLFPLASDATTSQGTPVEIFLGLTNLPDEADESVILIVEGMPDGATFSAGDDLGDGAWALAPSDLDGLMFIPPPGGTGVYTLTLKAVVTETDPETGQTDSATQTTTFTVTVVPVAVPVPDAEPDDDLDDLDDDLDDDVIGGIDDGVTDDTDDSDGDDSDDDSDDFGLDFDDFDDDDFDDFDGELEEEVGGEALEDVSADPDGEEDEQPEEPEGGVTVLPEAFASTSVNAPTGPTEGRVGLAAPGAGSLFAQPEPSQPAYGGNEKHPLPPVLPLDQSSSPAGFTESGGDSFALIDKLLRGDATAQAEPIAPGLAAAPDALPKPAAPAAAVADAAPPAAEADNDWRYWVAGTAFAGATAAWVLLSVDRARLARAARRLLHPTRRRPTEVC